jgi:hypothetical protein
MFIHYFLDSLLTEDIFYYFVTCHIFFPANKKETSEQSKHDASEYLFLYYYCNALFILFQASKV